jgi:hypothetical protein
MNRREIRENDLFQPVIQAENIEGNSNFTVAQHITLQCTIAFLSQSAGTLSVRDELFEGWSLYGRPPSALVASLRGWGQLQRSCLRAPL